jgi:hypothetical protein
VDQRQQPAPNQTSAARFNGPARNNWPCFRPSAARSASSSTERAVVIFEHYYPPLGEWVENRIYPGRDGGVAVFQRYVTERKRAEATRVSVIVERRRGQVQAVIEDDGRGFDLDAVPDAPDAARKLGVKGLRERAIQAGGHLDIETAPGAGTTVYVGIPLPPMQIDPRRHDAMGVHLPPSGIVTS